MITIDQQISPSVGDMGRKRAGNHDASRNSCIAFSERPLHIADSTGVVEARPHRSERYLGIWLEPSVQPHSVDSPADSADLDPRRSVGLCGYIGYADNPAIVGIEVHDESVRQRVDPVNVESDSQNDVTVHSCGGAGRCRGARDDRAWIVQEGHRVERRGAGTYGG